MKNVLKIWIVLGCMLSAAFEMRDAVMSNLESKTSSCAASPLPMWSWGFARVCCDIYPSYFIRKGFFESGDQSDKTYFGQQPLPTKGIVYVVTSDFSLLLEKFIQLPPNARIILVTGSEDIGTPYELFHPNRKNFFDYKMSSLWPHGQKMSLKNFLLDPRLVRWYAQNYDLVGCNHYTCSNLVVSSTNVMNVSSTEDRALVDKVVAIPIGLDLHSVAEKKLSSDGNITEAIHKICEQRLDLESAKSIGLPFAKRNLTVLAAFECKFDNSRIGTGRKKTRGEICNLIESGQGGVIIEHLGSSNQHQHHQQHQHQHQHHHHQHHHTHAHTHIINSKHRESDKRLAFWHHLTDHAFSLAPAGFGTDTHRLWESLHMGCVPITLRSTLDGLYSQFPIILLDSWNDLFKPGALDKFKREIISRFGENPFNEQVVRKLSIEYWRSLVLEDAKKIT